MHVPAQLYLDKGVWGAAEGPGRGGVQRDEEGPAISSKWPIVATNYVLLSRNASDEGDGHQRLALHARTLGFRHPVTGEAIRLVAETPACFAQFVKAQKV